MRNTGAAGRTVVNRDVPAVDLHRPLRDRKTNPAPPSRDRASSMQKESMNSFAVLGRDARPSSATSDCLPSAARPPRQSSSPAGASDSVVNDARRGFRRTRWSAVTGAGSGASTLRRCVLSSTRMPSDAVTSRGELTQIDGLARSRTARIGHATAAAGYRRAWSRDRLLRACFRLPRDTPPSLAVPRALASPRITASGVGGSCDASAVAPRAIEGRFQAGERLVDHRGEPPDFIVLIRHHRRSWSRSAVSAARPRPGDRSGARRAPGNGCSRRCLPTRRPPAGRSARTSSFSDSWPRSGSRT